MKKKQENPYKMGICYICGIECQDNYVCGKCAEFRWKELEKERKGEKVGKI